MPEQINFNSSSGDKEKELLEKRERVDVLKENDNEYEDSVLDLAKAEGEFRNKLTAKKVLKPEDINELADSFSDETLEKIEAKKNMLKDSLTGLRNKRAYQEELPRLFDIERRAGRKAEKMRDCSLMMIDFDHFKKVNDNYGHLAGDEALKKMAILIKSHVRSSDIVCRYGGEEFVVFLPNTDSAGALNLAEKIRLEAEKNVMQIINENGKEIELKITFSIGVAGTDQLKKWKMQSEDKPDEKQEGEFFLKQVTGLADAAVYTSKKNGRNQVTLWREALV